MDAAVEEAKASPFPEDDKMWTDVYVEGTEPAFMRGREREEVSSAHCIAAARSTDRGCQVHWYKK